MYLSILRRSANSFGGLQKTISSYDSVTATRERERERVNRERERVSRERERVNR